MERESPIAPDVSFPDRIGPTSLTDRVPEALEPPSDEGAPPFPNSFFFSPYILEAPDPRARLEKVVRLGAALFMVGGIFASLVTALPGLSNLGNPRGIAVLGVLALIAGMPMYAFARYVAPIALYFVLFVAIAMITFAAYFAGPRQLGFAAMMYTWQSSLSFTVLRKRWVIPTIVAMGVGIGIVLVLYTSPAVPLALALNGWIFTMGTVLVTGTFVSMLVQQVHDVATSERSSRREAEAAKTELFLLNRDLEDRVKAKVLEVERLSELRRLVSSNVADALLTSDNALEPHRREIAVFFIDLRGFTKFATDCDPEEVIQVLDEFYQALGRSFSRYGATVGAFEADGVMAYFNDPTPIENPAQRAVEMALDLRRPMAALVERWTRRGFDLHFGIGIALGYATMGMVGFEGRQDYTAIGTVVNLASRLCGDSKTGDILIDRKVKLAISPDIGIEELGPRELKGFREPVPIFRLAAGS